MSFFGDNLNLKKDSKLNNHIVRKSAWTIFLLLCLGMIGGVLSIYFQ